MDSDPSPEGRPRNSSTTVLAVVLPVLVTVWTTGLFHVTSPVLKCAGVSGWSWFLMDASLSLSGTTRKLARCVCCGYFAPGGKLMRVTDHWSAVMILVTVAQEDLSAESQGAGIEHDSVQAFWLVVGPSNSMVALRKGVLPVLVTAWTNPAGVKRVSPSLKLAVTGCALCLAFRIWASPTETER